MFDVGFWEVLLVGIVTLLVVGPDRLPDVARTAGRWVVKVRKFVAGVKSDFNAELQSGELHKLLGDQKEQIRELRSIVDSTRREIESTTADTVSAARKQLASVEEAARKVDTEVRDSKHEVASTTATSSTAAKPSSEPPTTPSATDTGTSTSTPQ